MSSRPHRLALVVACLTSLLVCSSASAQDERLAVLELEGSGLDAEGRSYLATEIRGAALRYLPAGWKVMDRGNMLALIDAQAGECAKEGECDVETFRNIGADQGVSGKVVKLGSKLRLSLRLYESAKGTLVRQSSAAARNVDGLMDQLPAVCARLFGRSARQAVPAPAAVAPSFSSGQVTEAKGRLRVEVKPRGAKVQVSWPGVFQVDPKLPPQYRKWARECQLDRLDACYEFGRAYRRGIGVGSDPDRAAAIYRYACSGGFLTACGAMSDFGLGAPEDDREAAQLYREACDGGEMSGCDNLGRMYATGQGVTKEVQRARQLYRQACDGGHVRRCLLLGATYETGSGVAKDPRKAAKLYRKACDGGIKWACDRLRELGH